MLARELASLQKQQQAAAATAAATAAAQEVCIANMPLQQQQQATGVGSSLQSASDVDLLKKAAQEQLR